MASCGDSPVIIVVAAICCYMKVIVIICSSVLPPVGSSLVDRGMVPYHSSCVQSGLICELAFVARTSGRGRRSSSQ